MTLLRALLAVVLLPLPALAQEVSEATGGQIRVLDKLSGIVAEYDLGKGQAQTSGRLTVRLDDCRYPTDNPTAEAYAHLTITDDQAPEPVFAGWMIASSPALSALDHPRYDVWVLRCDVPASAQAPATDTGSGG